MIHATVYMNTILLNKTSTQELGLCTTHMASQVFSMHRQELCSNQWGDSQHFLCKVWAASLDTWYITMVLHIAIPHLSNCRAWWEKFLPLLVTYTEIHRWQCRFLVLLSAPSTYTNVVSNKTECKRTVT